MEHTENGVPVFDHGDAFRIELEVSDESGVSRVEARFRNEEPESAKSVYRAVDLDGATDAVAVLEFYVDESLPPGNYACEYIALTDKLGNQSMFAAPGIEFRVEGSAADRQGPELRKWSFA